MRTVIGQPHPFGFKDFGTNDLPWQTAYARKAPFRVNGMSGALPSTNFTVEFQANTSGYQNNSTAWNGASDSANRWLGHYPLNDQQIYLDLGNIGSGGRLKIEPLPDGFLAEQHHHAIVFEAGRYSLYLDGVLAAQGSASGYYGQVSNDLRINDCLHTMGEFRIWTSVRTPQQIQDNMATSFGGGRPGLLACWRMDEAQVTGVQIVDRSGNGYHGVGI